jgi:hypothetical protein
LSCVRFCLVISALCCARLPAQAAERTRVELRQFTDRAGDLKVPTITGNDWFFRLPEHVAPATECKLKLLMPHVETLRWVTLLGTNTFHVMVNGQMVWKLSNDAQHIAGALPIFADVNVPEYLFLPGWNRVTVSWNSPPPEQRSNLTPAFDEKDRPASEPGKMDLRWLSHIKGHIELAFERLPVFPELRRFPDSLVEERLLDLQRRRGPIVSLLLPSEIANVHARGCAIVAARFGQINYINSQDCKVTTLERWRSESSARNGVMIGTRSELSSVPLPSNVVTRLRAVRAEEGLLAEIITPAATRWVIASGADDTGLEKALLCLGDPGVLNILEPGPTIVSAMPAHAASAPAPPGAAEPSGLEQLRDILVPDTSLRRTAFLLPEAPSTDDIAVLFNIALHLGRGEAKSVSPEACLFGSEGTRLVNRRVLFFSPMVDWPGVVRNARVAVRQVSLDTVEIQGRNYPTSSFEPSLAMLQLVASPWNKHEFALIGGGWQSSAGQALLQIFTNAAPAGRLFGNLCAVDALGRVVAFDTRRPSNESLADRIRTHIPRDTTASETLGRLDKQESLSARSAYLNRIVFYSGLSLMLLLIAARVVLTWHNIRQHSRALAAG